MAFTTSIELHKNTIYLTVGWFADMGPDVDLFHHACQAAAGSDALSRLSIEGLNVMDLTTVMKLLYSDLATVTNLPEPCSDHDGRRLQL